MPLKVVNSDPRNPRYYQACDVARIALNCVEDTGTPEYVVMACIAKKLGFSRVWVEDKSEAMQSDKWSIEKSIAKITKEIQNENFDNDDSGILGSFLVAGTDKDTDRLVEKYREMVALEIENAIAVESATMIEILEAGFETWLNFWFYRITLLLKKILPSVFYRWTFAYIESFFGWVFGQIRDFSQSISIDTDMVLMANPDWCTCMHPEINEDLILDKKLARDYSKRRDEIAKEKEEKRKNRKPPTRRPKG